MNATRRRVLLLNWRDRENPLAGGAEVHIWEVFHRLATRGWDIEMLCARFPGAPPVDVIEGIRVTRIAHPAVYHLALPHACKVASNRFKPHVVIDFMNKLPLYSPLFVRGPLCCFVHHLFGSSAIREAGYVAGSCIWAYEKPVPWIYRNVPFITGSESSVRELQALGLRRVAHEPMPYGVDTQHFKPGVRAPEPTLLYLGRLKHYKGIDHSIKVLPRLRECLPHLRFNIVGVGDARAGLESLARRLGVSDAVVFHGYVTEEEKLQHYQEAWLTCLPSYKEGFGLTIPEAALCQTPTVGYDVPGVRDAIEHGKTGLLVPYGDKDALAEAIVAVMEHSALREELGQAARTKYLEFTWERATERMEQFLTALIERETHQRG